MKVKTKILSLILVTVVCFGSSFATYAKNDNIDFKFKIRSLTRNSTYGKGRYRQTRNTNNQWKVQLNKSGEGKGSKTTFWLSGSDGEQVSPDAVAQQGKGAVYTKAYSSANERKVYLSGENNNWSLDGYEVSGVWDEETW